MNRTESLFLFFLLLTSFISCKKDKSDEIPATTNTTNTTNNGGISPSTATSFYATFAVQKQAGNFGSFTSTGSTFFSSPTPTNNPALQIPVDSVSANSVLLRWNTMSKDYMDTTYTIVYPPLTWKVKSSNNIIPSFTYTDNNPLPGFTGDSLLPDTIKNTQALTLTVSGVSNATMVIVNITDGTGQSITKQLVQNATSVTFSSTETATLNASPTGNIYVTCYKTTALNVYGKDMLFTGNYVYVQSVVIK